MSDHPSPPPDDQPLAFEAYTRLAAAYHARIDTKAHNAYLERPTTLALLPDVRGLRVLDAGCGPGWYSAWLVDHGAEVVGVDMHPQMVRFARERTGGRATIIRANLDRPLDFLADASFDLVLSTLVVHYVRDQETLFREIGRVLRPGGRFVFSTGHPFGDYLYFRLENYFTPTQVGADWTGFGDEPVYVPQYYHPLDYTTEALWQAGFVIERLREARPTAQFRQAEPDSYESANTRPTFLTIRARLDR